MVFGRRKSSHNVDNNTKTGQQEEVEVRRRNRLSKPLTSKSCTNLVLLALSDSNVTSANVSTEAVETPSSPQVSPQLSEAEKRQQMRTHLFDTDEEPERKLPKRSSWLGVAALVNRFEANPAPSNSSQTSLLSPKQRASATSLFSSRCTSGAKRPALSNATSMERVSTLKDEQPTNSASTSPDRPDPAFPTSRRSSFQPGVATRKVSAVDCIQEQDESPRPEASHQQSIEEEKEAGCEDSDDLSFSEGDDEEWFPPPQINRSVTPQSLDYTHLGGLRLGSLQVTNGQVSPATSTAASLASRHLLAHMAAQRPRDASSEYGDDNADHGCPFMLSATARTPPTHSREVSWYSQRTSKLQHVEVFELPTRTVQEAPAVDLTAAMAAEYIAELPDSPYKTRRHASSLSFREELFEEPSSMSDLRASPYDHILRQSRSLETISHRSSSPVPSVQSLTGSVLRTVTKRNEIEDELFDDETLGPSGPPTELDFEPSTPGRASTDSFHSWKSPARPQSVRNEAFESAVEFQRYPSRQKSRSPIRSPVENNPYLEAPAEHPLDRVSQRLKLPGGIVNSDSGYSSNNSVRSSSWERKSMMDQQRNHSPQRSGQTSPPALEPAQPKPPGKLYKPILKTRKTASAVPSFSEIRPAPPKPEVSTAFDIPKIEAEKPRIRKKLQKRNFLAKKKQKEVFVQSVASIDDLTIPVIPPGFQANLRIRSQQVPELQTTYTTNTHIRNQASVSALNLPNVELRFPSPEPESEPVSRSQSKSRRRSWLPKNKEDKDKFKHSSMISERDVRTMVRDFGSVNDYLGDNPYDLAREVVPVHRISNRISPFNVSTKNVSTNRSRPRSMFDDKTAAEIARLRSSSIRERDASNSRRTSFNDRGGVPGRNLRPASMTGGAPPMPPLPSLDVLERRVPSMLQPDAPPPPPPHSPQLSFVEGGDYFQDEIELAPPPPSHSPRPIDVTEAADPWAAQAAVWKARRDGADQTLKRQSYHEDNDFYPRPEEPLYPDIPLRGQSAYRAQRSYSCQPGVHDNNDYDFDSPQNQYDGPQLHYQQHQPNQQYTQSYHHQPLHQSQPQHEHQYQTHHSPSHMNFPTLPHDPSLPNNSRPLPSPKGPRRSPAPSIRSFRSTASIAEDLHPSSMETRPQPPPEFGRYSAGLQYGYEREKGFGGSAGTRSVSGKAEGVFKGVRLREGWGVDLGDVPVIGVVKPRLQGVLAGMGR